MSKIATRCFALRRKRAACATTDDIPKALVPVNGQPIIDYIVKFSLCRADWYICLITVENSSVPPTPSETRQRALFGQRRGGDPQRIHTLRAELPTGCRCQRHFHRYRPRSAERLSHGTTRWCDTGDSTDPCSAWLTATKSVWRLRSSSSFGTISSVIS